MTKASMQRTRAAGIVETSAVKADAAGKEVERWIDAYFAADPTEFRMPEGRLPLAAPSFGSDEVKEAVRTLLSGRVTMGAKVLDFERRWADYVGTRQAVMVNSGSSANLLALAALANPGSDNPIRPGDEIITPAVTWATTISPIVQIGARPVLVDVDPETMTMDAEATRSAVSKRTRALMPVHLLGQPAHMERLLEVAEEKDLFVIEDCCEAHGAEIGGRKVGSFGDLGTYSFFFSHHISTIEGGAVNANDAVLADLLRSMRAHGWIREMANRDQIAAKHGDLDPRFLFHTLGFNLRPTEVQAAFGIHQVPKLDGFVEARRTNARTWMQALSPYDHLIEVPRERPGTRHAWFGLPILLKEDAPFRREEFVRHLEADGIETRPIMSGNYVDHPAFHETKARVVGKLPVAAAIGQRGFFFGNHHAISAKTRTHVAASLERFLQRYA